MKKGDNKKVKREGTKKDQNFPDTKEGWIASNNLASILVEEGAGFIRPFGPFRKKK